MQYHDDFIAFDNWLFWYQGIAEILFLPSRHTTLFQRSPNVILVLSTLDGRCFDVFWWARLDLLYQVRFKMLTFFSNKFQPFLNTLSILSSAFIIGV